MKPGTHANVQGRKRFNLGARRAMEQGIKWAQTRYQFKRPLADFELVRQKIARMMAYTYAMDAVLYMTTGMLDRHDLSSLRACVSAGEHLPLPTWDDYVHLAFDEIRHNGVGSLQIPRRMRAALLAHVRFDRVRVPRSNLVAPVGVGRSHVVATALDHGRFTVAWGCAGLAEAEVVHRQDVGMLESGVTFAAGRMLLRKSWIAASFCSTQSLLSPSQATTLSAPSLTFSPTAHSAIRRITCGDCCSAFSPSALPPYC